MLLLLIVGKMLRSVGRNDNIEVDKTRTSISGGASVGNKSPKSFNFLKSTPSFWERWGGVGVKSLEKGEG